MSDQPPSPPTPTPAPTTSSLPAADNRTLATTAQLATSIENAVGISLEPDTLESLLLELDRDDYVEWVDVTQAGDHVWDLTESPDRIADAVAEAVAAQVDAWVRKQLGNA